MSILQSKGETFEHEIRLQCLLGEFIDAHHSATHENNNIES